MAVSFRPGRSGPPTAAPTGPRRHHVRMNPPVTLWRWYIVDEITGKRRLTKWHMTEQDALERYPDAERAPHTREVRNDHGHAADIVTKNLPREKR